MEMETQYSIQSQAIEQTREQTTEILRTMPVKQLNNNPATSICLGVTEIILRVFCTMLCIAVLVAAAVALSAISEVEDYFSDNNGSEYQHADGYRKAARWLLLVAVMGIVFHSLMTFIRYLYLKSCVKSLFSIYAYLNAALCVVFGLSLFAGGVANTIYAANNAGTIDDMSSLCDHPNDITADICDTLKTVRDSEAAAASLSFFTMVIFAVLIILLVSSGVIASQEAHAQATDSEPLTDEAAATRALSSSRSVSSSYMPLYDPLYTPTDAPPPYSP